MFGESGSCSVYTCCRTLLKQGGGYPFPCCHSGFPDNPGSLTGYAQRHGSGPGDGAFPGCGAFPDSGISPGSGAFPGSGISPDSGAFPGSGTPPGCGALPGSGMFPFLLPVLFPPALFPGFSPPHRRANQ